MVSRVSAARPSAQTVPVKPLLRRSTLSGTVRKYDEADLDSTLPAAPSSPSKRARVTFNPDVEEKVMVEWAPPGRSLDSVKKEVKRAIEAHAKHDSDGYSLLKEVFAPRREDERGMGATHDKDMRLYLRALSIYASILNTNCNGLVKAILAYEWMGREREFLDIYVQFLGSLCSTQGSYVQLVLRMLVGQFVEGKLALSNL